MIKILKAIYSILYNDASVQAIVGNKIFPDVVPDKDTTGVNIDYPLIVTRRSDISTEYSKCPSGVTDVATVDISCYSNSYFQAVDLAENVRTALEFYKGTVEGINIGSIRLDGITEDYVENVYYQQLIFSIR